MNDVRSETAVRPKVLVADDHRAIRDLLRSALEQAGYEVFLAEDGLDAVIQAYRRRPDAVLLDLVMPRMDGWEACARLRSDPEFGATPILMLTAVAQKAAVLRALKAGADDYLVKSNLQIAGLLERLSRFLPAGADAPARKEKKIAKTAAPPARRGATTRRTRAAQASAAPATTALIRPAALEARIRRAESARALPAVAMEVLRITTRSDASFAQLIKVIEGDASIAARVLRVANSAFYGHSRRVSTLQQAVGLIGFSGIRQIAVGVAILEQYGRAAGNGLDRDAFWRHSVACGILARAIALEVEIEEPEEIFLAGLLHDLGKAILDDHLQDLYPGVLAAAAERALPLFSAERALLGIDHAQLLNRITQRWSLPEDFRQTWAFLHGSWDMARQGRGHFRRMALAVRVANNLAKAAGAVAGDDGIEDVPDDLAARLELPQAAVGPMIADLSSQVRELEGILLSRPIANAGPPPPSPPDPVDAGQALLVSDPAPALDLLPPALRRLGLRVLPAEDLARAVEDSPSEFVLVRPRSPDEFHKAIGSIERLHTSGAIAPERTLLLSPFAAGGREHGQVPASVRFLPAPHSLRGIRTMLGLDR